MMKGKLIENKELQLSKNSKVKVEVYLNEDANEYRRTTIIYYPNLNELNSKRKIKNFLRKLIKAEVLEFTKKYPFLKILKTKTEREYFTIYFDGKLILEKALSIIKKKRLRYGEIFNDFYLLKKHLDYIYSLENIPFTKILDELLYIVNKYSVSSYYNEMTLQMIKKDLIITNGYNKKECIEGIRGEISLNISREDWKNFIKEWKKWDEKTFS